MVFPQSETWKQPECVAGLAGYLLRYKPEQRTLPLNELCLPTLMRGKRIEATFAHSESTEYSQAAWLTLEPADRSSLSVPSA